MSDRNRKDLVLDTMPETLDDLGLEEAISDEVDRVEDIAISRRAAARRDALAKGYDESHNDMAPEFLQMNSSGDKGMLALQGTTNTDCEKLLRSLGVQTSVQLTRNDTYNLLASLMSCNERQIDALLKNEQLPLAIKIVLKRLKEDAKTGDMENVYKLWDKLFGKGPLRDDLPTTGIVESGVFPSHPMSREAYAIIMKRLM